MAADSDRRSFAPRLPEPASLSSSARLYHTNGVLDPPPPPPAAYISPVDEADEPRKDSVVSQSHHRSEHRHDPDPIPPPPAKYSYPLPSISEALERFEARRSSQADCTPGSSPRLYPDAQVPALRRSHGPEAPRTAARSHLPNYPVTSNPHTGYSPATPTSASTFDSTHGSRKSSLHEHKIAPRSTSISAPTSHYEPFRPSYAPAPDGHYRPPYHPPAPYPGHPQSRDISTTQKPPLAAPIYTPSLETPDHVQAWQNSHLPPNGKSDEKKLIREPYQESVKRHLEGFDLDQSLNGIAQSSEELLKFSTTYGLKSHQTQRSGPTPGSTPQVREVDDMMRHGSHIQDSLHRLREVIISQEVERQDPHSDKASKAASEEADGRHEPGKGAGGFAGADPKKRRGRAAPPGKCHSCNRVDTPEWRRGPDGARTLCNACGLHYAKSTRKSGTNKAAQSNSILRPKDGSPVQ